MLPPKIDICIEGYNIEQTDFYITHIIDKYNSLNELYQKSCEHIVFLEKECKNGFNKAINESEERITNKLELFEKRLSEIEAKIGFEVTNSDCQTTDTSSDNEYDNSEEFKVVLSDFHSELEGIKSLFNK